MRPSRRLRRPRVAARALAPLVATTLVTGCSAMPSPRADRTSGAAASTAQSATGTGATSDPAASEQLSGELTVLAAASLREVFRALGTAFEQEHPGIRVSFSFAGSSALAAQVVAGAPADVLASASTETMGSVVAAGRAAEARPFATNSLQVAVPAANPGGVDSLADLADPAVSTALCQPQVPCGAAAQAVLSRAGVRVAPVTLEPNVAAVLGKVRLGEVDAGLVYVTDVRAAGRDVRGIDVPADVNATTAYPIAVLGASRNPAAARAFVDLVLSARGRAVLGAAGFGPP